jgi:hypothetical protein
MMTRSSAYQLFKKKLFGVLGYSHGFDAVPLSITKEHDFGLHVI